MIDLSSEELLYLKRLVKEDLKYLETKDAKSQIGRDLIVSFRKKVLKKLDYSTR